MAIHYETDSEPQGVESTPRGEAEQALQLAETLHNQLDSLEAHIFGHGPKAVSQQGESKSTAERQPLAYTLKHARQRLDSVASRFENLLKRL